MDAPERHSHDEPPDFLRAAAAGDGVPDDVDLVAHHLRRSLTVLKGNAQVLLRALERERWSSPEEEERLRRLLQNIHRATNEVTYLSDQLVVYARANGEGLQQ